MSDTKIEPVVDKSEWRSFTSNEYAEAIEQMVHQSFKTTNTNIDSGGVRVGIDQAVSLPYIGIRSLLSGQAPLRMDRIAGANQAPIYGQIQKVDLNEIDVADLADVALIKALLDKARRTSAVFSKSLSPRIRQIFLPKENGDYLCITPLSAAGVSYLLKDAVTTHNDKFFTLLKDKDPEVEKIRFIPIAEIPIGGAKPFNAGDVIRPMTKPICIDAPSTSLSLKKLLALYYKGVERLNVPTALRREYIEWRNGIEGHVASGVETREKHRELVARITRHFLLIAIDAKELLDANRLRLPDSRSYSHSLSDFQKGLLNPELRTSNWEYDFARQVSRKISNLESAEHRQFEYSQDELNTISSFVRGAIQ